jgi:hypothetical protein
MVSNISGLTGAGGAFGVDPRLGRAPTPGSPATDAPTGDRVEISASSLGGAQASVSDALRQLRAAIEFSQDAQAFLVTVRAVARGDATQETLTSAVETYGVQLDYAREEGVGLLSGEDLVVQAEPGASPFIVEGADFALGAGLIAVTADASADDPQLDGLAQRSLESLQRVLGELTKAADALQAHQVFLGAAEAALGVRADLDAEGARLTALQVRQGLEAVGAPIANAEPAAVLGLFRA